MPNTIVPAISGALPAWSPTISDAARTILNTVTRHLDGLRADVERELVEHSRCRRDVEALIERLIAGLDEIDGEEDLEGQEDANGFPTLDLDLEDDQIAEPSLGWTAREAAKGVGYQAGYDLEAEHDGRETTATETAGRGFVASGPDDAEDGGDREADDADIDGNAADVPFDWKEQFNGILITFKGDRVMRAHACKGRIAS